MKKLIGVLVAVLLISGCTKKSTDPKIKVNADDYSKYLAEVQKRLNKKGYQLGNKNQVLRFELPEKKNFKVGIDIFPREASTEYWLTCETKFTGNKEPVADADLELFAELAGVLIGSPLQLKDLQEFILAPEQQYQSSENDLDDDEDILSTTVSAKTKVVDSGNYTLDMVIYTDKSGKIMVYGDKDIKTDELWTYLQAIADRLDGLNVKQWNFIYNEEYTVVATDDLSLEIGLYTELTQAVKLAPYGFKVHVGVIDYNTDPATFTEKFDFGLINDIIKDLRGEGFPAELLKDFLSDPGNKYETQKDQDGNTSRSLAVIPGFDGSLYYVYSSRDNNLFFGYDNTGISYDDNDTDDYD